jgi:peptidoglycan-N-acetylglucosamine deacetylase
MDRRRFLTAIGLGVLALGTGTGAVLGGRAVAGALDGPAAPAGARGHGASRALPLQRADAIAVPKLFAPPTLTRVKLPGGTLTGLPGEGNLVALTVDDGADADVIAAYAEFAARTGMRFTFFVTAQYEGWRTHAAAIREQVEQGRIQIGNHTWTHPDLTKLGAGAVRSELDRTGDFIQQTFGVDARPYYRPPFGYISSGVTSAARASGWGQPVLWYGSLSDSGPQSDEQEMQFARQWMLPQHIVIGHANFPAVTHVMDQIAQLIVDRKLQPVTLNDVFSV